MKIAGVEYNDDEPLWKVVEDLEKRGEFETLARMTKPKFEDVDSYIKLPCDAQGLIDQC